MRRKLTTIFLTISVLLWGTWFGGQLFNETMVIPKWLFDSPASMKAYDAMPAKGGFLFFMVNPLFTIFSLLAMLTGWKESTVSRKWLITTTVIGFLVSLIVIFYLAPLIHSTNDHALKGDLLASQVAADAQRWMLGNRLRLIAEFFGFLCSVISLYTWAKDAFRGTSGYQREKLA